MQTKRPLSLTLASFFLILALLTQLIVPLAFGARLLSRGGLPNASSVSPNGTAMPPTAPGRGVTGMPGSRFFGGGMQSANPGAIAGVALALLCASAASAVGAIVAAIGLWRSKRWGMIVALVVALLGIGSALPGLVGGARFFVTALPTLARIALLTAVAVLALLPSSLDAYQ
jgi:hypothetical protein